MAKSKQTHNMFHIHVGILAISSILLSITFLVQNLQSAQAKPSTGFDELGYNRRARIFNGAADGVDGTKDYLYYGTVSPYAFDKLTMKWNSEWDRGNDEGWTDTYYNAWLDNHWNGLVPEGSGENWHYRIKWVGPALESSEHWVPGGYPIWGQFEVIMSHGTVANEHFWDAHARPAGYRVF